MDNFHNKTYRKVRFNLPDIAPQLEHRKPIRSRREHGTVSYVNGTLMNTFKVPPVVQRKLSNVTVTRIIYPTPVSIPTTVNIMPPVIVSCLKQSTDNKSKNESEILQKHVSEIDYKIKPPTLRVYNNNSSSNNNNINNNKSEGYTRIPRKNKYTEQIQKLRTKHMIVLNDPVIAPKVKTVKMYDCQTICDRFSRFRLFDDILMRKRKTIQKQNDIKEVNTPLKEFRYEPSLNETTNIPQSITVENISKNLFVEENHSGIISDLIHRWKRHRLKEELKRTTGNGSIVGATKAVNTNDQQQQQQQHREILSFRRRFHKTDVRSLGCLKMSLEKDPPVTTLLRAAHDADEDLLKVVFRKILIDGISKEALNATDKSGRTAVSYICSTDLLNYLDILIQLPELDINKADNEGNTPLHFAAQAGQADSVNMMLTRCRNLQIDVKNCLGFTPLMKAALQGRTRCAKLLLFAGASPVETDSGRKLNAVEWARFCGRETCAEMLEKCTKARQLEKSNSVRSTKSQPRFAIVRSKTNPIHPQMGESFRAKFKKLLPFSSNSHKDKNRSNKGKKSSNNSENKDLVNYLSNSAFCASGPTLSSEHKNKMTALIRPLEVPKLEITPANNQHLIKKYEEKMKREIKSASNGITSSPRMIRN